MKEVNEFGTKQKKKKKKTSLASLVLREFARVMAIG
jgi:hypothetical protein